ncbi:MAG TPA: DUF2585 family protein [Pyrinomonadaceae bacterium]|jgi:hypothetical protein
MPENFDNNYDSKKHLLPVAAIFSVIISMILLLRMQGRIWWCKTGDLAPFTFDAWSTHTSQHLFDPYSFTHILHGVMFFWLVSLLFRRSGLVWRFIAAVAIEAVWEVAENTNAVIEHYRQNTASLDYFGDSIFNSLGDVIACAAGFYIAYKLGWKRSLVFFLATEIVLLVWIRDSLLLNILMLIYPLDSIKNWQIGG